MRAITCMPRFFAAAQQSPEEIARAQIFAFAVKRDFGLIEGENPRDADEDGVHFEAAPVIGPLLDIEFDRIVLGHVQLPDAANTALPRNIRRGAE